VCAASTARWPINNNDDDVDNSIQFFVILSILYFNFNVLYQQSEVPSRDTKANSFQYRRAEFRTKVNLNKEKSFEVISSLT
jgi:hypothetical protein